MTDNLSELGFDRQTSSPFTRTATEPEMAKGSARRGESGTAFSEPVSGSAQPGRVRNWWNAFCAAIGAVAGLVPHVLHHVGFLVGSAALAGVWGSILFGALGLALSIPFLFRLRRRFGTWHAPGIALLLFVAMFAFSAFVVGPAISNRGESTPPPSTPSDQHSEHHSG